MRETESGEGRVQWTWKAEKGHNEETETAGRQEEWRKDEAAERVGNKHLREGITKRGKGRQRRREGAVVDVRS